MIQGSLMLPLSMTVVAMRTERSKDSTLLLDIDQLRIFCVLMATLLLFLRKNRITVVLIILLLLLTSPHFTLRRVVERRRLVSTSWRAAASKQRIEPSLSQKVPEENHFRLLDPIANSVRSYLRSCSAKVRVAFLQR